MTTLDLFAIRHLHGGTVYDGGRRWVGPGPGHSRRDNSLSVRLEEDGRALVHSFAGDPFRICAEHLGLELSHTQRADPAEAARLRRKREQQRREQRGTAWGLCEELWARTLHAESSLAERYLTGRGLPWPYLPTCASTQPRLLTTGAFAMSPRSCDLQMARRRACTSPPCGQTDRARRGCRTRGGYSVRAPAVRKGPRGEDATTEDGREAAALLAAVRSARVLNVMSEAAAITAGIERRRAYFRMENGKANLAPPPEKASWFHFVSQALGNGTVEVPEGDSVGVVTAWEWPDHRKDATAADLLKVQQVIAAGEWRKDAQCKANWVGLAVARALDFPSPPGPSGRRWPRFCGCGWRAAP